MAKRFLIVRFSSIGDIVLTTPVLRCIKKASPDAHITYVTKKAHASILQNNPYVDEVLQLEDSFSTLRQELENRQFDYLIDLHNNIRSRRLLRGIPGSYHPFPKLNLEKWLLVNFKINRLPDTHIVNRYLSTVASMRIHYDGEGMDYFIPESTQLPDSLPAEPYVAIALGGQHATKRMPESKVTELLNQLLCPVVLLGGKEDAEMGDALIHQYQSNNLYNLAGKLSLDQSALACKKAVALLTHDTGMMHIAAAMDIPVGSVWGNTVPEFGMYPFFAEDSTAAKKSMVFEVKGLNCRPCSKIGYEKCPKGHFKCMLLQDTAAMAAFLNRLWAEGK